MADQVPGMDWSSNNLAESFKLFQQRIKLYFSIKNIDTDGQVPIILLAVGEEGLRCYNSWSLTNEQQKQPDTIFTHFLEQLEPSENFRISRLKLSQFSQNQNESLDEFINRCKILAQKCDFTDQEMNERIIEQIISSTPIPEYQKELLNEKKGFTIQEAVELGRSYEASLAHMHTLHTMNGQTSQLGVSTVKQSHGSSKCKNCGGDHRINKDNCPARNDNCRLCNKRGHWAKFCLTTKYKRNRSRSRSQNKHSSYRMRSTSPRNRHQQQRTQHRHRNVHTVDNSTMNP